MATQVVTGTCNLQVQAVQNGSNTIAYQIPATINVNFTYANASSGAGNVDQLYAATLSLTANSPQVISLANLVDVGGNTINMARVREFVVTAQSTTAGQKCGISGGTTNGWAPLPPIATPAYVYAGATGFTASYRLSDPVSTGSGNGNVVGAGSLNVSFDPGVNSQTIKVQIMGCSVI